MLATRYAAPQPARVKSNATQIAHISAPLKGLNLSSKLSVGDPLTAPILTNFLVEDDRIICRPGTKKIATMAGTPAIVTLVPYHGPTQRLAAAGGHQLFNALDGTLLKPGFTADDWSWSAFANLGQAKFTVMVNGADGVWSWDGTLASGGFVKEAVTAPATETWIIPDQFNIVVPHMNRLFFADGTNSAIYYLPIQQKSGEVKVLPLNALFRRGGSIRAMASWTLEGGTGINDQLCIFSSNGELVIYAGTDPDTDFQLVGIFRFDAPLSKHSVVNWGGEVYALISTGLVPMSTMLRAESEQLGKEDKAVISLFQAESQKFRARTGWELFLNPSTNRLVCNMPQGAPNKYGQMVRHMQRTVWSQYADLPARCWGWVNNLVYFGDDSGNIFQMSKDYLNDDGAPIRVDVQMAWSQFKTSGIKQFKMVQVYMVTDGVPHPFIDIKVDYDTTPPQMQPDVSFGTVGSTWDVADWDVADWTQGGRPVALWNGIGRLGRVGAPRLTALIKDCEFAITGFDVVFEPGAAI
jgi:hypothetical protein